MMIVFLFQPLFLNFANHIFRVLSPHRPYQELNIISSLTINVHRKLSLSSRQNPDSENSKRLASPWWPHHTLAPLPPPLDGHQSHHPGFPLSKGGVRGSALSPRHSLLLLSQSRPPPPSDCVEKVGATW